MDRTERFYKIELLIRSRAGVNFDELRKELEVSPATLKRDLQYLRDRMDAPIVYDRDDNVYRFADGAGTQGGAAGSSHQLPGVWFSEKEIRALLTMHQLIAGLDDGGVLGRHLQPMLDKLHGMLGASAVEARALMRRVRIVSPARRPVPSRFFEEVVSGVLSRRRLAISYYTRSRRSESERVLSPQRLLHYRNTWYLDAWCHASEGLRRFALDAMRAARVLDEPARELPLKAVEEELDQGYGVFGGSARLRWATLHFNADAAQWVAQEEWHPQQRLTPQADGSLRMRLPYTEPTELVMDVMRHGPAVRVVAPAELAEQVRRQLEATLGAYADGRIEGDASDDAPGAARASGRGAEARSEAMNKAFTKEPEGGDDDDDDGTALPPLPAGGKNYITPAGHDRLRAELLHLIDEERPKVVEVVHWAASNGDRSENGDYIYGKKRLREIDRRIRFLTKRLDIAVVADPSAHHGGDQIFFGATVTYANAKGEERTVTIKGIDEVDPLHGEVSWISPIARTLLKAREGDSLQLVTPGGVESIEVVAVSYPEPKAS